MTGRADDEQEPGPGTPDDVVEVLARWERAGGHWTVLSMTEAWIEVGLLTCDGAEQMGQVGGAKTPALSSFLADRHSTD